MSYLKSVPTLVLLALLTGCVTETTGPVKKDVNPQEVVEKLINLGNGYLQQQDFGRAKENLRKALRIDPNSALAHASFGFLFQLEGDPILAEDHFKHAIRIDPNLSIARNNYGAFLFGRGRYADAITHLKVAADDRFYARRPQVFENLGVAYLRLDKPVEAEDAFIRAIELNPSQGRALLELGNVRFEQQRFVEAKRLYDRHSSVSQQSSRSLWLCIRLARKFNENDKLASCELLLKNIFPTSEEFKLFEESK